MLKRLATRCGVEVSRSPRGTTRDRCSLLGSLRVAASVGFRPATVVDVGAARGEWTRTAALVWPKARFVLVDPLEENRAALAKVVQEVGGAVCEIAALDRQTGSVVIHVHPDLDGSSLYEEREQAVRGTSREIGAKTVDQLVRERELTGPYLLKADVQGAELAVIDGAAHTLEQTELVVLEVLMFDFFQGCAPQLADLVAAMAERGFIAWDIFGMGYRPIDEALAQVDIVFVREDGFLRRVQQYATEGQRREQLARLAVEAPGRVARGDA